MTRTTPSSLALPALAGLTMASLSALPAGAHGGAATTAAAGALHPLLGLDHLLLLVGVGLSAARFGPQLLLLALAGGVLGSLLAGRQLNARLLQAAALALVLLGGALSLAPL